MELFKNILIVCRSSRNCPKTLNTGFALARQSGANLYVLHVIHDPFNTEGWNLPVPAFQDEYRKMMADAKTELDRMIRSQKAEGLWVTDWVEEGNPVEAIQKAVESKQIDLIIMLAHREGHLEHFLFGRTNDAIIRRLPATLMLVK